MFPIAWFYKSRHIKVLKIQHRPIFILGQCKPKYCKKKDRLLYCTPDTLTKYFRDALKAKEKPAQYTDKSVLRRFFNGERRTWGIHGMKQTFERQNCI